MKIIYRNGKTLEVQNKRIIVESDSGMVDEKVVKSDDGENMYFYSKCRKFKTSFKASQSNRFKDRKPKYNVLLNEVI